MADPCAGCGVAISGADVLYTPDGRTVCAACFDKVDAVSPTAMAGPWRGLATAGAVFAAIPFAVSVSESSSTSINGQIEHFVYRDWVAIVCGAIAIGFALIAVWAGRKASLRRSVAIASGLAVLVIGAYQLAKGFGVFATPG